MDAADLLTAEGISGCETDVMSMMIGVAELVLRFVIINSRIYIIHGFIGNMLMKRIIGHKR